MKNNVTRRSLTKRIRILEVVANLELLIVAIFVYIFDLGMFGIICDLIIYCRVKCLYLYFNQTLSL